MESQLLFKYLRASRVEEETLRDIVIPHLFVVGAKTVDDLEHVEKSDLNIEGTFIIVCCAVLYPTQIFWVHDH